MAKKERDTEDEAEALVAEYGKSKQHGTVCSIKTSGYASLIDALRARGVASSRIRLILQDKKGIQIGESSLARHSNGTCLCRK